MGGVQSEKQEVGGWISYLSCVMEGGREDEARLISEVHSPEEVSYNLQCKRCILTGLPLFQEGRTQGPQSEGWLQGDVHLQF